MGSIKCYLMPKNRAKYYEVYPLPKKYVMEEQGGAEKREKQGEKLKKKAGPRCRRRRRLDAQCLLVSGLCVLNLDVLMGRSSLCAPGVSWCPDGDRGGKRRGRFRVFRGWRASLGRSGGRCSRVHGGDACFGRRTIQSAERGEGACFEIVSPIRALRTGWACGIGSHTIHASQVNVRKRFVAETPV